MDEKKRKALATELAKGLKPKLTSMRFPAC
jgi:hypothetical protein